MRTPRTIHKAAAFVVILSVLSTAPLRADSAQEVNPLFVEASGLSEELESSTLNDSAKSAWRRRFDNLKQEQQQLWDLAGQVDSGRCRDSCINLYNSRVLNWESRLRSFNQDARAALRAQQQTPESMQKCASACDRSHSACWKKCLEGPISENESCHKNCNERKIQCVNRCYGVGR